MNRSRVSVTKVDCMQINDTNVSLVVLFTVDYDLSSREKSSFHSEEDLYIEMREKAIQYIDRSWAPHSIKIFNISKVTPQILSSLKP